MSTLLIYIPTVCKSSFISVSLQTRAFSSNTAVSWSTEFLSTCSTLTHQVFHQHYWIGYAFSSICSSFIYKTQYFKYIDLFELYISPHVYLFSWEDHITNYCLFLKSLLKASKMIPPSLFISLTIFLNRKI